jgi:WD40 repeat protein
VYALVERGNSRSQARRAHAEELAAEALTGLGIDPPSSLRMAYEAALLRPGAREEGVLRSALMADRLRGILRTGGPVTAIGYGSSGRSVVVASRDGKARIYRQGSLRPLHVLGLDTPITAADISADGRHVAIGAEDGGVRAWMPNLSHQVEMRPEGRGRVRSVALANRDSWIVAGFDEAIRVWRRQGTPLASIALHNGKPLVKAVVPDNGRRVIALARSSAAWVYALPSGKRLFQLEHDGLIEDAAFSPGGRWILTGGYAGDAGGVRLWDARNGHLVREIVGALRHVQDVAFSADGKLLAAGAADGTARVWETRSGLQLAIMIGHTNRVTSVNFNRSGTALVSASSDGTARVWGASGGRAGRVLHVLAGHRAEVVAALFSPDGRAVITGSDDGTARLWDPGSEPPLTLLARSRQPLNSVAVRDAGQRIVVSREDGSGELRRLNGTLVRRLADASVSTRDILDRGSNVAAHVVDRSIVVTDPRTGRVLHTLRGHTGTVNSIHLSPDAKLLVSASDDHDARIWDVESGRLVQKLHGHFGPVLDARFSPDGRWVVTAGPITAGLWLVGSTAGPIFLDAPVARPLSATAFAGADGRLVVATSLDGTLRSYYCDICGDAQELIALAKRRLTAEH